MKRDQGLRIFDAQTVSFALKTPWSDGTTHVLLSPEELIEKLAALVPPSRCQPGRVPVESGTVDGRRSAGCVAYFVAPSQVEPPYSALAKAAVRAITLAPQCPAANLPAGAAADRRANWSKRECELEFDTHRGANWYDRSTVHEHKRRDNWEDTLNR